jgi:hemerythrin-like domain-containing protein
MTPTFDIMATSHQQDVTRETVYIDNYVERAELALHSMLRKEWALLVTAASRVPAGAQARAIEVARHAEVLIAALELHCRGETEAVWPLLADRCHDSFEWPRRILLKDHSRMDQLLEALDFALERWCSNASAARRDALIDIAGRIGAALDQHLDHEEQLMLTLMKQHVAAGEFEAIVETQAFNFEPWLQTLLLGMLMQQGDAGVVERASATVAAAVRRRAAATLNVAMYQFDVGRINSDRTFPTITAAVKRQAATEYLEHCLRVHGSRTPRPDPRTVATGRR